MSQPRVPAGSPGGGRFATAECPATYRLLAGEREPSAAEPVVQVSSNEWRVYAPICPHGHYRGCKDRGCPGPR